MNLQSLSKKQQQYVLIGAASAIGIVVLSVFIIKGSMASVQKARIELDELAEKIESADRQLSKKNQLDEKYNESVMDLVVHTESLPTSRNLYAWAAETIYTEARTVEFEIESIEALRFAQVEMDTDDEGVRIQSYALRVSAKSGFSKLKEFLMQITETQPLLRVSGVEIGQGAKPDIHNVELFLEWPVDLGVDAVQLADAARQIQQDEALLAASNQSEAAVTGSEAQEPPAVDKTAEPHPPAPRPDSAKPVLVKTAAQKPPQVEKLPEPEPALDSELVLASKPELKTELVEPETSVKPETKPTEPAEAIMTAWNLQKEMDSVESKTAEAKAMPQQVEPETVASVATEPEAVETETSEEVVETFELDQIVLAVPKVVPMGFSESEDVYVPISVPEKLLFVESDEFIGPKTPSGWVAPSEPVESRQAVTAHKEEDESAAELESLVQAMQQNEPQENPEAEEEPKPTLETLLGDLQGSSEQQEEEASKPSLTDLMEELRKADDSASELDSTSKNRLAKDQTQDDSISIESLLQAMRTTQ